MYCLVPLAMADHRLVRRCREGIVMCFPIIAWQSWFRCNRHFVLV